jgi:hypothetical protein
MIFILGITRKSLSCPIKGYQALKDNRLADAEYAFTDLLQMAPDNNYALVGLGDVFARNGPSAEPSPTMRTVLSSTMETTTLYSV